MEPEPASPVVPDVPPGPDPLGAAAPMPGAGGMGLLPPGGGGAAAVADELALGMRTERACEVAFVRVVAARSPALRPTPASAASTAISTEEGSSRMRQL